MRNRHSAIRAVCAIGALFCAGLCAGAEEPKSGYAVMAPLDQYRMASPADEIALARSAAPTSIAGDATVLILGNNGYEPATKGRNGFVCLVWRSWEAGLNDPEFWNPRIRSPLCLNAAAARSILPASLERTKWALAGLSRKNIGDRIKAAVAANTFAMPAPGAMAFMMSKTQYLDDTAGHWHPHVMFFVAHTESGD